MGRFDKVNEQDLAIQKIVSDIAGSDNSLSYKIDPLGSSSQNQHQSQADMSFSPVLDTQGGFAPVSSQQNYSTKKNKSDDNWYSGAEPTYAEYVARVYSKKDSLTPDEFNNYIARIDALKSDPKWEHYNPYKQGATSKDVAGLAALGIDVSNIDDKWIEANKHLLDGAYYTDVGTKPAKGKTPSQNAAYYYSNIVDQYESTKTIQNLAEELKQEVMFKASLTDKNYSDQQILDSIDWNGKYKWLNNLGTEYAKGHIYEYTAPIDFDRDELAGYMWAGRNDGGTGDSTKDAVMAALGQGNVWQENAELAAELNPASGENYKPYKHGGTAEDVLQYFGATSLPAGWVEKAEKTINWNDDQAVKMLQAGKKAEDFTVQAEKEAAEIKNRIAEMPVTATTDIDEAMEVLYSKWGTNSPALSTLQKLDDPQYSKTLQQTTRSIDYSRADVKAALQEKIDKEKWKETLPEFAQTVKQITTATNIVHGDNAPITGVSGAASGVNTPVLPVNQSALAVNDAKTKIVQSSIKTILGVGTEDEKRHFTLAPVVNSEAMAAEIGNSIQTGTATAGDLYETASKQAQDFVTANYLFAKGAIEYYDGLNAELADLEKNQAALVKQREELASRDTSAVQDEEIPATGDWDWQLAMINDQIARDSAKQAELDALDMQISLGEEAIARKQSEIKDYQWRYDEAKDDLAATQSMIGAVAMQSVWRTNPDADFNTPEGQKMLADAVAKESGLVNAIDHVMSVGREYKPTVWSPSTVFQAMTENGATKDEAQAMARSIAAESDKAASTLNQEIAQMQSAGVDMPAAWKNNLDREKALQERNAQEAKDYLLQAEPGFEEAAKKGTEAVKADKKHEYSDLSHAILDPENARTTVQAVGLVAEMNYVKFVNAMTQDEKDTYAAKLFDDGEAAAVDYYERLTDPSYGILQTRVSGKMQEAVADFAEKAPVLASAVSVAASPLTIAGSGYTLYSLLTGKEINPHNEWFYSTSGLGTMEATAKEKILEPLEEGSPLERLASLGYDALTSGLKSLEGATLFGGGNIVAMGLEAAGAAARDVKLNNGSDLQTAAIAGITFAAESLSEIVTTQNIAEAMASGAKGVKGVLKKVLSNDLVEEFVGESATQLVENLSDTFVMGELSQRNQAIKEYEKNMSHEEAVKQADIDFWKDFLAAGVTGALSAAGTSGISYAAGRLTANTNKGATVPSVEGRVRANALTNGLPLDGAAKDLTARTLTMLTSSLNANQSSQVQAVSAALFPVTGSTEGQQAAVSAGLHMAARFGSEQAVSVVTDVLRDAMLEGADIDTVKNAVTVAALGKGEALDVLKEIAETGITGGDISALVEAAARDTQNSNIQNIIEATVKNDRILARERDLIGDGALNAVRPYEQAYNRAMEAAKKAQAALEAEQERAKVMGENLKTVQAQHVEAPDNQAVRGAMQQATKDVVGQTKVVDEYQQALERQQQEVKQAEKDLEQVRQENMTKVREQAIADVEAQVQAEAEARAEAEAEAAPPAQNLNAGIAYTNDQVPVSYHYALVNASDLITSNTDTGEANPVYPAELQPRDRTRAASQDQIASMIRNLNPARLGESADVQNGAPIIGADNVVESGNARTMAIRQAMATNPDSAARYTQYLRENAARFGLNPDDVTDSSVLVRVRDTDLDRVAFARAANESTTAGYSASETAQTDAAKITPRMMELFAPADNGKLDNTDNHAFVLAFMEDVIPQSERGAYMQSDGTISQQGYERIRNAVFQRAYGNAALTQALTEDTDSNAKNLLNALTKAAPRMVALQDAIEQGGVYNVPLAEKIADAAKRYIQLRNAGLSVETYLGQTTMDGVGMQTEDADTQALMLLYEQYRRSSKKLSDILGNIAGALEDAGDPRTVSFLGENAAPGMAELIRQGVQRTEAPKDNISFRKGTSGQTMPQSQNSTSGEVVSGHDIVKRLTDALGITNDTRIKKYLRSVRKNTLGYTRNNGVTHTRYIQDAQTAIHEIGHNLDVRLGLQRMVPDMAQLESNYSQQIDPRFKMKYTAQERPGELMADFARVWALDRDAAVALAGDKFVEKYERALKDHGWLEAMQTASQQLQRWTNASDYEKGLSTVKLEVPKEKTKPSLTVARSIIADHTLPLEKITETIAKKQGSPEASEDARHLLLDMPSIVKNFMESTLKGDGLVDQYGDLVLKDNGTPYGSLADVLSELDLKKIGGEEEKAFNLYLLAKLDVERRPHNKAVLPQDINPQELIKFIESKYPKFKPTSEKLYDFYNKAVETWLVDTNIKDRSLFDALRKLYPSYVPLHSADEKTNRVSGKQRTDGNPANILERAFESDASKYNPVMGMVENIQKYIMRAKTVEALRAFDSQMKLIQENGWDVGGIADPAQKDLEKVDLSKGRNEAEKLAGKELAQLVQTGVVDDVAAQAVLDSIENVKDFTFVQKDTATGYDVINIPLEDGTISSWTIYDPQLLKALTMTGPNGEMNKILRAVAPLTRFLSANATSRNFKFSGQNVFSDEETSATTGKTGYNRLWKDIVSGTRPVHAAKTIASGVELLYNKIADTSLGRKFGMETSEAYEMFKRFGLLGNRYAFRDTKTQREVRRDLYGGKKTLGEALADLPKNIFKPIEIVTGFGEEMSRYGIFAHSGFDLSTYNGRLDAARASREGTTDFSKFGSGRDNPAYQIASSVIPFLNAQIQGVNKTIDMVHEIKNDPKRRAVLLGRAVTNSLLAGAVTAIFRQLLWGEDEEEGYKDLTDYEKTKYVHLYKNPDGSWTKMKRSQDMLLQFADLLGEYIGEVSTGYEGDAWSDLVNGAWEVIKNGTISTDTSLQPIFDALAGKTWYGGDTDTYTERQMSMTARYGEDTSKFARLISTVSFGAVSPKAADYAIQQFLSSAGEMGTVAFDTIVDSMKDGRFNGQHLYKWFKEEVVGGYTIDPVMSNKIATTYYSDKERLEQIKTEAKDGKSPAFLRYNLSQDEMDAAVAEANKLLSKGGAVYEANSRYGALKKEYNKVLSPDSTLTMQQQDEKARKIKQEMNQALLDGNTAMGDFFRKYGYVGMFDQAFYNSMDIFTDSKKIPETQSTNSTNSLIPSDYGTQKESLIPANWGTGK